MPHTPKLDSELVDILRKTRNLVAFHQSIGINEYPMLPELKDFLTPADPARKTKNELQVPEAAFQKIQGEGNGKKQVPKVSLADIHQELKKCARCGLHENRSSLVFGMGNDSADLLIIGDAPSPEDDRQGEPFCGEAGELLDKMLNAIGLSRKAVYLTTLVNCRPPGDRQPTNEEIDTCLPFLHRQIATIAPKVICTMGTLSSQALLNTAKQLIHLRGRFHDFKGIPLMPTFQPDFLIRNPELKKASWEDLKKIKKKCSEKGK